MSLEHSPARTRRLRRNEASKYLLEEWGLHYSPKTLAKLATIGGGPPMQYAGRFPLYPVEDGLDAWAEAKIGPVVRNTAEGGRQLQRISNQQAAA